MKKLFVLFTALSLFSCNPSEKEKVIATEIPETTHSDKIKVLNFGTFHFGYTNDATSTEFDEKDKKNQKLAHEIAQKLAAFKPTIILVEDEPEFDSILKSVYANYLKNPAMVFKNPSERELLAFEIGRLSGTTRIYGIDHQMGYNYAIGDQMEEDPKMTNRIDPKTYLAYKERPFKDNPELEKLDKNYDNLNLFDKLKFTNHPKSLDFSLNINADNLLYVGTQNGFEGADEAAKFYLRNMRIYSNINRISMTKDDRVFILMGSAHTAFLREFMQRSPKFELVDVFEYLK